ncbi:hypothetical protein HMPREF0971_03064 [Segatella oris F0302]|uniref:Transposase DDE domain-containing protein n=1 Tax=Segatella oris F0302 TaxID=649760 RepID=D1QVM5_9BACT|nr:hypothetical protein HMPREF0971_03064 [Segatella oris F0302]
MESAQRVHQTGALRKSVRSGYSTRSWLKARMKNKLIPMWDKIMLRKRYCIECINELLKNKATPYTLDTD